MASAELAVATGKRKTAIARVRLRAGTGQIIVNGKPLSDYLPRPADQLVVNEPFEATSNTGRYDVVANVHGGGPAGQAGALRHGIARAIESMDENQRLVLKRAGYLTRDSRKKERKKYGQKGARARFQFSKR